MSSAPEPLLLRALRAAPRRYRLPPLPADLDAARAAGVDTSVAFAIEAARTGRADAAARALFLDGVAFLVACAVEGDPGFQALVLRAQDPQVEEYVQLFAQAPADRRAVRSAVDAVAHPGKLRAMAAGPRREALARLHALAEQGEWSALRAAAEPLRATLPPAALARLERAAQLRASQAVRQYEALQARRGPLAGSDAATLQGRSAARAGSDAEAETVESFRAIADLLPGHRAVRGLRTPGAAHGAKAEWDAAILRGEEIALLAEVKASPAAVSSDFTRLLRGLHGLAQASADESYVFPTSDGDVRIAGASLRALQPHGNQLPPHVVYCCSAPPEAQPALLSAAAKGVLLTEPACIAYAAQLAKGGAPAIDTLGPLWGALTTSPRLRPALHQYDSARQAREAMLHPRDLLAAVAQAATASGTASLPER